MLNKIVRFLFPATIKQIEIAAAKAGARVGAREGYLRAANESNRRMSLMLECSRIGKTPGIFTYRDVFMVAAISGAAKSLDNFPRDRVNDIHDSIADPYPVWAYPDFGKNKKK